MKSHQELEDVFDQVILAMVKTMRDSGCDHHDVERLVNGLVGFNQPDGIIQLLEMLADDSIWNNETYRRRVLDYLNLN